MKSLLFVFLLLAVLYLVWYYLPAENKAWVRTLLRRHAATLVGLVLVLLVCIALTFYLPALKLL